MSAYSVAEAEASLQSLIDRAIAGEEVVILQYGEPVVELKRACRPDAKSAAAAFERLARRRVKLRPGAPNSVELLNMIYDEEEP